MERLGGSLFVDLPKFYLSNMNLGPLSSMVLDEGLKIYYNAKKQYIIALCFLMTGHILVRFTQLGQAECFLIVL